MEELKGRIEKSKDNTWIDKYKAVTDGIFRKILALVIIIGAGSFLFDIAKADTDTEIKMAIVGYAFGVITTVIAFYYGTSQSSQDKENKKEMLE